MAKKTTLVKQNLNSVQITPDSAPKRAYHHGDLKVALIEAGEAVLAERGLDGFSLRETARRAGVSPGAPAHHFGEARGLLTAIAALGFQELDQALGAANDRADQDGGSRLKAQGKAYIHFAISQPHRFDLMWRQEALNPQDETYGRYAQQALEKLQDAAQNPAKRGPMAAPNDCAPSLNPKAIAAWSLVHGFATLALLKTFDAHDEALIEAVLEELLPKAQTI